MTKIIVESFNQKHRGIFNNELNYGLKLNLNDQILNSEFSSKISKQLLPIITRKIKNKDFDNSIFIKEVTRRSLTPILFFFFDRYFRLNKITQNNKNNYCFEIKKKYSFEYIEQLEDKFKDYNFNNHFIFCQKNIFDLKIITDKYPIKNTVKQSSNPKFQNNIGRISNIRFFLKLLKAIELLIDLIFKKKILTGNVAHFEDSFRKRFFFFKYIRKVVFKAPFNKFKKVKKIREKTFSFNTNQKLIDTLIKNKFYDLSFGEAGILLKNLEIFLIENYPIQSLEGLEYYYNYVRKNINLKNVKLFLVDGDHDHSSTVLYSYIASLNHIKTIRFNHGGCAAYIADSRYSIEMIYPRCDYFISWGITKFPNSRNIKKYFFLPNPWLSEKSKYWKKNFLLKKKKFDVLYMPQLFKGYTGTLEGGSAYSRDTLDIYINQFRSLIIESLKKNISIVIKPYSINCFNIINIILNNMRLNENKLLILFPSEKSLSKKLLCLSNMVIHDYPGTGFMETTSSNIPSLILWNKYICRDNNFFKNFFIDLKKDKIIHHSITSLLKEVLIFKKDPKNWSLKNINKKSYKNFVNYFCNINYNWHKSWIKFFSKNNF